MWTTGFSLGPFSVTLRHTTFFAKHMSQRHALIVSVRMLPVPVLLRRGTGTGYRYQYIRHDHYNKRTRVEADDCISGEDETQQSDGPLKLSSETLQSDKFHH